jgi:hypothetical protein
MFVSEVTMKRATYACAVILIVALTLGWGCKNVQEEKVSRNTLSTAEDTVMAYCDLDARGNRLTSETWSRVLPFIAWTEEAGWDRTIVISGYKIAKIQTQSDTASTIMVEYQVLGIVSGDYAQIRKTENIPFTVKKTKDGWKITSPDFMPPHVLLKSMVKHLEGTKNLELAGKLQAGPKD